MEIDPIAFWPGLPGVVEAPAPAQGYRDAWVASCYMLVGTALLVAVLTWVRPVRASVERFTARFPPRLRSYAGSGPAALGIAALYLLWMIILAIGVQFWPL
jgi:hypothetical protein